MAELFDQYQPKSTLARKLNEAFEGIDGWSVSPRRARRATVAEPERVTRTRPSGILLEAPGWVQEAPR